MSPLSAATVKQSAYQGCDPGYPVVWCEFSGGHQVPMFSGDEIWTFFSQF